MEPERRHGGSWLRFWRPRDPRGSRSCAWSRRRSVAGSARSPITASMCTRESLRGRSCVVPARAGPACASAWLVRVARGTSESRRQEIPKLYPVSEDNRFLQIGVDMGFTMSNGIQIKQAFSADRKQPLFTIGGLSVAAGLIHNHSTHDDKASYFLNPKTAISYNLVFSIACTPV